MIRIFLILLVLGCLPTLIQAKEYKIKPEVLITKENYERYLPELKRLLLPTSFNQVINALGKGWITIPVLV
ncbi:MAG: hypothetical protein SV062_03510 [Thermodesulfobacteriota bacterium]|nr:hypothetical protein [Thermodesulfobacteriota bacterium]